MHLHTWKGKLVLEIVTCTRVPYSLITQCTFNGLNATWADEDNYCVYGCVLSAACHTVRLYAGSLPFTI